MSETTVYLKRESTIPLNPGTQLEHDFLLSMIEVEGSDGRVFYCEVNNSEIFHPPLTAVRFASVYEAQAYNMRVKERPLDFKGFLVFACDQGVFVLGDFIGFPFHNWVIQNHAHLWRQGGNQSMIIRARPVTRMGRQIATILTDRHEDSVWISDLMTAIYVKGDCDDDSTTVTLLNLNQVHETIETAIANDLEMFQRLIKHFEVPENPTPLELDMFYKLFPAQVYPHNLGELEILSYKICHAPIFWNLRERLRFSTMFWELKKEFPARFQIVTLNSGNTDVGEWVAKVKSLPRINILFKVYDYNRGAFRRKVDIMSFHRDALAHCLQHDFRQDAFVATIDRELLDLFPDAYPKAYHELLEKFYRQYPYLIDRMKGQEVQIYFGKK